jgi:hypothetical protein
MVARAALGPYVLASAAVLPLLVAGLFMGWRIGLSDPVLSVIAPSEQPLSVRTPVGPWSALLALAWFAAAYWIRRFAWWEVVLVALAMVVVLARAGNAWLSGILLLVPLARRSNVLVSRRFAAAMCAACLIASGAVALALRPPPLQPAAHSAVLSARAQAVLADWRWAAEVQSGVGNSSHVYAAGGLTAESTDFWLDYLRVSQGHERWAEILHKLNVDLIVLDAADQQSGAARLVRTSPEWRVTFDDGRALVAIRNDT